MFGLGFHDRGRPNPGLCPECGHANELGFGTMTCDGCGAEIPEDPLARGMIARRGAARARHAREGLCGDIAQHRLEWSIMGAVFALIAVAGAVWWIK